MLDLMNHMAGGAGPGYVMVGGEARARTVSFVTMRGYHPNQQVFNTLHLNPHPNPKSSNYYE